ncbi:MAG: hypothetical protein CMC97_06745 [Flavobacteriales bacterium]|nr:hypothetical protein [Flavobacteriales bacterium]
MKLNSPLLLLALPFWLASCMSSMDLIGERALEADEFYLSGGEPHVGDDALEAARQQQLLNQYDQYAQSDYDTPYTGTVGSGQNGQLWNRYTGGFNSPYNSFGTGFGYSPYSSFGFGTPYGFSGSPYSPFNAGFGSTYGQNNFAFQNGYDAWGNPIGGFGNPYTWNGGWSGYGPGWGYDPWGGGYWGSPNFGYWGGGYHPHYGNLGAYGNPGWGGFCGTGDLVDGSSFTAPRPRPSFGQFTGLSGTNASGEDDPGSASPNTGIKPDATRGAVNRERRGRRGTTVIPPAPQPSRDYDYGRQSPDRSGEPATQPSQNRSNRSSGRSNSGRGTPTPRQDYSSPSTPRGGGNRGSGNFSRPSSPRPSAPRPSSGRSGRGG